MHPNHRSSGRQPVTIDCPRVLSEPQNKRAAALDYQRLAPLLTGRLAAIVAILTFVGMYVFSIREHGLLLGIAFGWLPAAGLAWLSAAFTASAVTRVVVWLGLR